MTTAFSLAAPFRLIAVETIDSTNDEAKRAALAGAGHGTVVWAQKQTAGRGRRGREWISPAGNLHCSLLLDGGSEPSRMPQLAFVAAIAVRAALAELVPGTAFQVKWPNDVLCQGRKISGMLLEQASGLVVVGIGVDVAFAPEAGLYPTTCLRQIGSGAESFDVLTSLCDQMGSWYARWREEGFAPIRQAWLDGAAGLSGPVTVRLSDETTLEGTFAGLDPDGALMLVQADGGQRKVLAGDVFFRR